MTSLTLELRGVRKRREVRWVLDGVTLSIGRGVVYALLGESGTGKSTLLRCIQGLETIDEGEVNVGGRALRSSGVLDESVRRRVGLVFQQHHLFAHRTALENVVEAPIHVGKMPPAEAHSRAVELLERLGVAHRRDARPADLSGGESQRVAIARAMAMGPEVLLLDEPTSALDPARRRDVARLLRGLAAEGTSLLVATHDLPFAKDVADRAGLLGQGRLLGEGRVEELVPGD
ncbi:MAG TPA: ATP-binding cassette domain-containing protein [Polyangiaceae bacterium]|nr:ATP-binding cassette domain-containing protein [Polyangiaceae bacterium]